AYGELLESVGSTINPYLFAGEQYDPVLEEYYLRARYYDPSAGRFTARDPFEGFMNQPLSLAKYPYVHGNPVNATDPTGLFLIDEALRRQYEAQLQTLRTQQAISLAQVTKGAAIVVAAAIFGMSILSVGSPPQNNNGLPYIVWGLEFGVTTVHTDRALRGDGFSLGVPSPPTLTYRGRGNQHSRTWIQTGRTNAYPCSLGVPGDGLTCDEYPYASTDEGGETNYRNQRNVSIALVPGREQNFQGNHLRIFYGGALNWIAGSTFGVFADTSNYDSYYVNRNNQRVNLPAVPIYRGITPLRSFSDFDQEFTRLNP
ncbi:MAG: RHS repeat-associated core domain-containing protein, partial [Cyanobacteriota bacterium]|nr:RHS repeat-associated core domain-containing protein [Cyanobacteriota bacterium]